MEKRSQNNMSNPHYIIEGRVVEGNKLGRTIGFPTANIDYPKDVILPPEGCYVTVTVLDGERKVGLTNVGRRPTVDNLDYCVVENHILDFSGDLYGEVLIVEFLRFIRPELKFDSLSAVKEQIEKDLSSLKEYIEELKMES